MLAVCLAGEGDPPSMVPIWMGKGFNLRVAEPPNSLPGFRVQLPLEGNGIRKARRTASLWGREEGDGRMDDAFKPP